VGWLGLSLRSVFLLAAVPAALSLLVLAFGVKEEKAKEKEKISSSPSLPFKENLPLPPLFWRAAWLIAFFTLSASSDTFLLLRAKEIGVAAAWLPVLWAFSNVVRAALSTWGGGLSDRFGRRQVLLAAWTLYALCYAGFAFVSSPWPLVGLVAVYSTYYALSEGTERALVADLVPAESRGRAFGWMNGLMGFAALPASVGFGLLWEHAGSKTAFLTGAAIAAIAAAVLLVLRFPRPHPAG
jgi:MFS family permease